MSFEPYSPELAERLYAMLDTTTTIFRKGEVVEREESAGVEVVHVYRYPHESEADDDVQLVDCHFVTVGVRDAASHADEFKALCDAYPDPERLAGGPSYIEVGGVVGSQDGAFRLFALGEALGVWTVVTPKKLGMEGPMADQMAGAGYVMCSGYQPEAPA